MKIEQNEYIFEFTPAKNVVELSIATTRQFSNFSYDIVVAKKQTSSATEYNLKGLTINSSLQTPDGPATFTDSIQVNENSTSLVKFKNKGFEIHCSITNNEGQFLIQHLQTINEK
jgi:hypothetical protein